VTLLARTTQAAVRAVYPSAQVFRVEPNTPVELRKGVLAFAQPDVHVDPQVHEFLREHFARVGTVIDIPERLLGVAGACSGVGPAYWALLAEGWIDAAVRHGMPAAQASVFVTETMAGTAALLAHHDGDTLALRRAVASPGGTTARGLAALERGGVRTALGDAMDQVVGTA
jgi:pyrroline-5-carboxylate reductase